MFLFSFTKYGKTSYLLGSDHYFDFSLFPELVRNFILSKKTLIGEHGSITYELMQEFNFFLKPGDTPPNISFLDQDSQRIIKDSVTEYIEKKNFTFKSEDLTLTGVAFICSMMSEREGMDTTIKNQFKEAGKTIKGLEEEKAVYRLALEKLGVFNLLVSSVCQLKKPLYDKDDSKITEDDIYDFFYQKGLLNTRFMEKVEGALNKEMLADRNYAWIGNIESFHKEFEDSIFCVGAAHLMGTHGIIRLLIKEGYSFSKIGDDLSAQEFTIDDLREMEDRALYNDFKYNNIDCDTSLQQQFIIRANEIENFAKKDQDRETLEKLQNFIIEYEPSITEEPKSDFLQAMGSAPEDYDLL